MIAGAILFTITESGLHISNNYHYIHCLDHHLILWQRRRFNKASTALKKSEGKRLSFREKFRNFLEYGDTLKKCWDYQIKICRAIN